jgi:hypothetical protein
MLGYHVQRNIWRRLPELPLRLRGANGWLRGDTLQLAGGAEVNNAPSNRHRWMRALRGVWMALPGEGPTVREPRVAVVRDALVMLGNGLRPTWHYQLASGRWGAEDDLPYRPRQGAVYGATSDGRSMAILGGTALGDETTILQSFDLGARTWTPGKPVPKGVPRPTLVAGGGALWLVGGAGWIDQAPVSGVVYRLNRDGGWDSVAVTPEPRFGGLVTADSTMLCVVGGDSPQGSSARGIQCMDIATMSWRSSGAGELDSIPAYIGTPYSAAAVDGRVHVFGRSAYRFDPSRNRWDSIARPPFEAGAGVIVADGDRLLQYSVRTRRVWMMWP